MAKLDFGWEGGDSRRDEIGELGRSLNEMARRLSTALKELEAANQALRGEVEREREQERKRMAFFSAASHELKTPLTVILANTGILLRHPDDTIMQQQKWVDSTKAEGERLKEQTEHMLSRAHIDTTQMPLNFNRSHHNQQL